mgnify:FL=1|tara:strand:- start:1646 stop:2173 length:528 start_codon:yes stop_codon:yes gene_type:complete
MNKIIVSIILAVILVLGINKISDVIFYVEKPEKSAYQVANVSTSTTVEVTSENQSTGSGDIMVLLTSANASEGEKIFKQCAACHSIAKGGANKIGPALWGVLGRKAGSVSDYKYSKAMASYGKSWSFEEMSGFLLKPKEWIKGTKMSFMGLKKAKDRAAVILYMNQNTDIPLPIN